MSDQVLREESICSEPTILTVTQKEWSWLKKTDRGFSISDQKDGTLMFMVDTKTAGKFRLVSDSSGDPVFKLERNVLSKGSGWILKSTSDDNMILLSIRYSWVRPHISDVTFGPKGSSEPSYTIKARDLWSGTLDIIELATSTVAATIQCTNMKSNILSSFKTSPPVWSVKITQGIDVALQSSYVPRTRSRKVIIL
ncbi:hypothetical protein CLAFUW4_12926 [Fulvia fulva]|uniref:Uncharacterized protein n=1 Tax=Passalora fulva TaxID=5499 RepID=A0A9Q8PJS5_PASFU|nr:uncharacterized protein CLAFUR5_12792 [Fulvia fulva]KAK4612206.1 hypothetical protein CLAFUR4_12930 [Fulvia fulva]UJO23743.1 hypothetical protein CLAFUR5_12792 [Fulvia fulva]WPV21507.1 hypothetical protein CLAFUW4_12926 [Fulvia fulva]WPV36286.1 hypothetical protein CLAFUW7_12933 [Fulvia fulva]